MCQARKYSTFEDLMSVKIDYILKLPTKIHTSKSPTPNMA